jgi:hypothetical protein
MALRNVDSGSVSGRGTGHLRFVVRTLAVLRSVPPSVDHRTPRAQRAKDGSMCVVLDRWRLQCKTWEQGGVNLGAAFLR